MFLSSTYSLFNFSCYHWAYLSLIPIPEIEIWFTYYWRQLGLNSIFFCIHTAHLASCLSATVRATDFCHFIFLERRDSNSCIGQVLFLLILTRWHSQIWFITAKFRISMQNLILGLGIVHLLKISVTLLQTLFRSQ